MRGLGTFLFVVGFCVGILGVGGLVESTTGAGQATAGLAVIVGSIFFCGRAILYSLEPEGYREECPICLELVKVGAQALPILPDNYCLATAETRIAPAMAAPCGANSPPATPS